MNHATISAVLALLESARNRLKTGSMYGADMQSSAEVCREDAVKLIKQALDMLESRES